MSCENKFQWTLYPGPKIAPGPDRYGSNYPVYSTEVRCLACGFLEHVTHRYVDTYAETRTTSELVQKCYQFDDRLFNNHISHDDPLFT